MNEWKHNGWCGMFENFGQKKRPLSLSLSRSWLGTSTIGASRTSFPTKIQWIFQTPRILRLRKYFYTISMGFVKNEINTRLLSVCSVWRYDTDTKHRKKTQKQTVWKKSIEISKTLTATNEVLAFSIPKRYSTFGFR